MADHDLNQQTNHENEKEYGVLLYYKYAEIPELQSLFDFYHSNCTSLSLLGRVRLSSQGVNVTVIPLTFRNWVYGICVSFSFPPRDLPFSGEQVGGKLLALEKHIEELKSNPLFEGTDFKLASCSEPLSDQVAKECGFTSLSIRIVKVVIFIPISA